MLSTRFSVRRAVLAALLSGAAALSALRHAGRGCRRRHRRRPEPSRCVAALLVPYGSGDPGRERSRAASRTRRGWRRPTSNATIDLAVYPSAGTTAGGAAAAQQAIAEGAKIIVGPLFTHRDRRGQPAAASGGRDGAQLLQQPLGRRRQRLHPRHHLREHRRPAGSLRPVAGPAQPSASSTRRGSRARPRATPWPRSSAPAAPRSSPRSPTTFRSRASRPPPGRRRRRSARAARRR